MPTQAKNANITQEGDSAIFLHLHLHVHPGNTNWHKATWDQPPLSKYLERFSSPGKVLVTQA
jgi:diadenosine tetraphosphate (Ap4A) HIT family hydrolase